MTHFSEYSLNTSLASFTGNESVTAGVNDQGDGSVVICYSPSVVVIPTMTQWGLFLLALIIFTIFVVGIYNMKKAGLVE